VQKILYRRVVLAANNGDRLMQKKIMSIRSIGMAIARSAANLER
jgi:hypothetical protein